MRHCHQITHQTYSAVFWDHFFARRHNPEGLRNDGGGTNARKPKRRKVTAVAQSQASRLRNVNQVSTLLDGFSIWVPDKGSYSYDSDVEARFRVLARGCPPAKSIAETEPMTKLMEVLATAHGAAVQQGAVKVAYLNQFVIATSLSYQVCRCGSALSFF